MMRIVVCVKAVPASTEVRMDPVTHTIVRDGGSAVVNPFDAAALEVALRIKEGRAARGLDSRVSVLSMGIPATEGLLRDCIARGADEALLLSDRAFAGADTLATSYALSCGLRELGGFDLIVCGKMAVDGDTAQIGPMLAGLFDVPCITDVRDTLVSDTFLSSQGRIRARHGVDGGIETVVVPLPAVITVSKDIAQPRMPSMAGVLASRDAEVAVRGAAEVGADAARIGLSGSPTQVVRSFVPERANAVELIEGTVAEQARRVAELIGEAGR